MHKFREQEIGIYDFLLLKRDDLIELQLPIAARNRIMAFQQHFQAIGFDNRTGYADQTDLESFNMEEIIRKAAKQELMKSHANNTDLFDFNRTNELGLSGV